MQLFDSHAHLDVTAFDADRTEVLARAREAGVTDIVLVAAPRNLQELVRPLELARTDPRLYATVGVHPHDCALMDESWWGELDRLAGDDKIVAIGETGLDYYYDYSPHEVQRRSFAGQIELAKRVGKPVVCHVRDPAEAGPSAHQDSHRLLDQGGIGRPGAPSGVIHCFTGGPAEAAGYVELGLYISFSGIITFKSAEAIRQAVREVPADRLLIETDCPFLSPIPKRGKRNEPANLVHTAKAVAEAAGMALDELADATSANARALFSLTGA